MVRRRPAGPNHPAALVPSPTRATFIVAGRARDVPQSIGSGRSLTVGRGRQAEPLRLVSIIDLAPNFPSVVVGVSWLKCTLGSIQGAQLCGQHRGRAQRRTPHSRVTPDAGRPRVAWRFGCQGGRDMGWPPMCTRGAARSAGGEPADRIRHAARDPAPAPPWWPTARNSRPTNAGPGNSPSNLTEGTIRERGHLAAGRPVLPSPFGIVGAEGSGGQPVDRHSPAAAPAARGTAAWHTQLAAVVLDEKVPVDLARKR